MNLFNSGRAENDRVATRAVQSGVVENPPEGCLWHLKIYIYIKYYILYKPLAPKGFTLKNIVLVVFVNETHY